MIISRIHISKEGISRGRPTDAMPQLIIGPELRYPAKYTLSQLTSKTLLICDASWFDERGKCKEAMQL